MSDIGQRIRERAYRIWLDEGCPQGRELDHWDKATQLVAIEDGQRSTLRPIEQNLGPVCTENSNADVMVMKPAKDRA